IVQDRGHLFDGFVFNARQMVRVEGEDCIIVLLLSKRVSVNDFVFKVGIGDEKVIRMHLFVRKEQTLEFSPFALGAGKIVECNAAPRGKRGGFWCSWSHDNFVSYEW